MEVFFQMYYYYWGNQNSLIYWGLCYRGSLYGGSTALYFLSNCSLILALLIWPVPHLCWSTTYISFLNHIIFCLILLFQHGWSLLFAVGFLTRSLFATTILTAATNSILVSPEAYHPEASKFPLFICLEPCWGFLAVQSEEGKLFCPNMDSEN